MSTATTKSIVRYEAPISISPLSVSSADDKAALFALGSSYSHKARLKHQVRKPAHHVISMSPKTNIATCKYSRPRGREVPRSHLRRGRECGASSRQMLQRSPWARVDNHEPPAPRQDKPAKW